MPKFEVTYPPWLDVLNLHDTLNKCFKSGFTVISEGCGFIDVSSDEVEPQIIEPITNIRSIEE